MLRQRRERLAYRTLFCSSGGFWRALRTFPRTIPAILRTRRGAGYAKGVRQRANAGGIQSVFRPRDLVGWTADPFGSMVGPFGSARDPCGWTVDPYG